jgi:hypothetical protein
MTVHFCISTGNEWVPLLLQSLPAFGSVSVLDWGTLIGVYWLPVVWICISLTTVYSTEFQMFTFHLCVFFSEVPVQIYCPGFKLNWIIACCWVLRILCIFWIAKYQIHCFANCSSVCGLCDTFGCVFYRTVVFNFNEVWLVNYFFQGYHAFGVVSKSYHQTQDHLHFLLCYLLDIL